MAKESEEEDTPPIEDFCTTTNLEYCARVIGPILDQIEEYPQKNQVVYKVPNHPEFEVVVTQIKFAIRRVDPRTRRAENVYGSQVTVKEPAKEKKATHRLSNGFNYADYKDNNGGAKRGGAPFK
jgi:predicted membrane metal-binding protein